MTNNTHSRRWPLLLFPIACLALLLSCAGNAARQDVLLPAMRTAWTTMRTEVAREVAATSSSTGAAAAAAADAALAIGTPAAVAAVDWPTIEQLDEGDITRRAKAGEIGPGVAASLRERAAQFRQNRLTYARTQ